MSSLRDLYRVFSTSNYHSFFAWIQEEQTSWIQNFMIRKL